MIPTLIAFIFAAQPTYSYGQELDNYVVDFMSEIRLARSYPQRLTDAQGMIPIVLKYGERYNVDPLLTSTILRYEGSWRKGRKGARGEVGPMQVMPRYFKDFDLTTLDGQIHAGISHLRTSLDKCKGNVARALYYYASNKCVRTPPRKFRWRANQYHKAVAKYRGKDSKNAH